MSGACPFEAPALMHCLICTPPLSHMSFSRFPLPCSAQQVTVSLYVSLFLTVSKEKRAITISSEMVSGTSAPYLLLLSGHSSPQRCSARLLGWQ